MNPTTDVSPTQHLVMPMREQIASLTRTLSTWMLEQSHTLADIEPHVVQLLSSTLSIYAAKAVYLSGDQARPGGF